MTRNALFESLAMKHQKTNEIVLCLWLAAMQDPTMENLQPHSTWQWILRYTFLLISLLLWHQRGNGVQFRR